LNPFKANSILLGVVVLSDRLAIAALDGGRGGREAFSIDAENPAAVLAPRELTQAPGWRPRTVALGLARSSVFVKAHRTCRSVGSDLRENWSGSTWTATCPFAAEGRAIRLRDAARSAGCRPA